MKTEKTKTQLDNELFIKFLGLKEHGVHAYTYMLWDNINPIVDYDDIHDSPCIKFVDWCHINSFKFQSDWNWLMYVVQVIRKRILIPMDMDWNNFRHEHYQQLRRYLLAKQEEADKTKLYEAVVEMMQWWIMHEEYKKRKSATTAEL